MHPHKQYKNIPNKNKQLLIPKKYKLPTTLNTTAKDKAQNTAQQRLIKNAVRRIRRSRKPERESESPERSEGNQTQLPPLNPEERGMSGPEPPPSEARVSYSNHRPFPLILHPAILSARREARSPAGSGPCDVEQGPAKTALTIRHKVCFRPSRHQNAANAHAIIRKRVISSRQPPN